MYGLKPGSASYYLSNDHPAELSLEIVKSASRSKAGSHICHMNSVSIPLFAI